MSLLGAFYLSVAACIWGGMYVVSKYALDFVPPLTLLFLRYLTAGLVFGWLFWRRRLAFFPDQQRGLLLQVGAAGFLSLAAQFIGTRLSSAHMGAVITTLSPLFLSLLAIVMLKEKMTLREGLAGMLAFSGVSIVIDLTAGGHGGASAGLGNLALLLAALLWGYYSVLVRKVSAEYSALQVTAWGVWIAAIFTLPFAGLEFRSWQPAVLLTAPVFLSVLYLGLISTAVALFSWSKGLALLPSHQAGLFFFFQPVVGSLLGWLALGEQLTPSFFAGSLLILAAVYMALAKKEPARLTMEQAPQE